jgi:hypothetical protein
MRWILYGVLTFTYAATIAARLERAAWMPQPTAVERLSLWLPLVGLAALVALGFRRNTKAAGGWLLSFAMVAAMGCLCMSLIPSIQ